MFPVTSARSPSTTSPVISIPHAITPILPNCAGLSPKNSEAVVVVFSKLVASGDSARCKELSKDIETQPISESIRTMGEKRGIKEFCFCRHQLVIF
jgi:hypothetical protein